MVILAHAVSQVQREHSFGLAIACTIPSEVLAQTARYARSFLQLHGCTGEECVRHETSVHARTNPHTSCSIMGEAQSRNID